MEQTDLSIPAVVGAVHGSVGVAHIGSVSMEARVFTATSRETRIPEEFCDENLGAPLTYLNDEFPSLWPYVSSTISNSLARFFVSFLPQDQRIMDVLWAFEPHLLRIWTVIDEPDLDLERKVYEAERRFLNKMDDSCDFTIMYAFGKSITDIRPTGAVSVK